MKVAIITDQHFDARNSSPVIDRNYRKFYSDTFFPYLKKNNIKTLICGGDTFDKRKNVNLSILDSCKEYYFDELRKNDIKVLMLVGNHDAYFKNTIKINSPRLLLSEYKNIMVIDEPKEITIGNRPILFMPWICDENQELSFKMMSEPRVELCIGHFEIQGFQMFKGQKNLHGIGRDIFKKFKRVLSGHFHHRSTEGNITYLGNPMELTWADYNDPRGFHVMDTDTMELEFIKNPNTLFRKVYYDEKTFIDDIDIQDLSDKYVKIYIKNRTDFKLFDNFLNDVNAENPIEVKIIDEPMMLEENSESDENIEVEDLPCMIDGYIDTCNGIKEGLDRDVLKNFMRTIHIEAIELENK